MVLYTPLHEDDIFPKRIAAEQSMTYHGRTVYVKEGEHGEFELVRLMSSNPQDYLNPRYTPGTKLTNDFLQQMK